MVPRCSLALVALLVDAVSSLPVVLEPLPGVSQGWNTSVGSEGDRRAAAEHFGVTVADGESMWRNNIMRSFNGKTLHMTDIDIIERNPFNTLIEFAVKTGTVLWTINEGPQGVVGPWTEHINGDYTGVANIAGWVSPSLWIENDNKHVHGLILDLDVANDWGLVEVLSKNDTTMVLKYSSYKKAKFIMTWTLTPDIVVL